MAQKWRVARLASDHNRPRLDAAALDRVALDYVARYATTRAKLRAYLERKLAARGWAGEEPPPLDATIARLAGSGFVDDRAFALARTAALSRRGYGARRVGAALHAAGIDAGDAEPALAAAGEDAWSAAAAFAKRRKIGPFSTMPSDQEGRRKAFAAMLRAGHSLAVARAFASAAPGEMPDPER